MDINSKVSGIRENDTEDGGELVVLVDAGQVIVITSDGGIIVEVARVDVIVIKDLMRLLDCITR